MAAHTHDRGPMLPGFEPARVPIARASDPKTSHEAAQAITESGKRDDQLRQVEALVIAHPGATSLELAKYTSTLDRYAIARRLPELEAGNKVHKGLPRNSEVSGQKLKKAVTWWPGRAR
jgi:hypothetical protein